MTIKCGNCGQQMVVEGALEDGQHVKCPFCGEITAYSKPARIPIPTRVTSDTTSKPPASDDIPDIPREKPKLAIRRPPKLSSQGQESNALVDRVRTQAKQESRRAFWTRIQKGCQSAFSIILLIGIVCGGWWLFRHWKDQRVTTELSHLLDEGKKIVQKESDADSSAPNVKKQGRQIVKQEANPKETESLPTEDDFKRVLNRFSESRVLSWKDLPKDSRPGKIDALFSLWCPVGNSDGRFFEIKSSTTGIVSFVQYQADGLTRRLETTDYEKLMIERGGFVCRDNEAYFVTSVKSPKTHTPPLRSGESFDPSAEYFKAAQQFIRKWRLKTADVEFEVLFAFPDKEAIPIAQARYGEKIPYARFKDAVAPLVRQLRRKSLGAKPTMKPYHATVVFYDGQIVSKGIRGLTKVPRSGSRLTGQAYNQWLRLRDEASRQESKAQESEWQQRRSIEEWQRKIDAHPSDAETTRVLAAGNLSIVRK